MGPFEVIIVLFIVGVLGLLYFLPVIIAGSRNHHQLGPVIVINTFLGWTLIGWVAALAMAVSATKTRET